MALIGKALGVALALSACARNGEATSSDSAAPPPEEVATEDAPAPRMCTAPLGPRAVAADLADAHSIIARFAELASKRDAAGTLAMFDLDAFVDRVTEGTTLPGAAERARLSFRVAWERAVSHGWQWHRWRVVDAVPEKDGMIIAMEGTTVGLVSQRHEFWVRPVDGEQRIYDLYDVALGQRLSDLFRELAIAMHNPPPGSTAADVQAQLLAVMAAHQAASDPDSRGVAALDSVDASKLPSAFRRIRYSALMNAAASRRQWDESLHFADWLGREGDPPAPEAHFGAGWALLGLSRATEARDAFARYLKLVADDPWALTGMALASVVERDLAGVDTWTCKSISVDPYAVTNYGVLLIVHAQSKWPEIWERLAALDLREPELVGLAQFLVDYQAQPQLIAFLDFVSKHHPGSRVPGDFRPQ